MADRDEIQERCKRCLEKVNKEYVEKWYKKWEEQHNSWAKTVPYGQNGQFASFSELIHWLRDKLLEDWRYGLAFFVDRTTYLGIGDKNCEKISFYMIEKILSLCEKFEDDQVKGMISEMRQDKANGKFKTIRKRQDIDRLESIVVNFLIPKNDEKNFTKIVLTGNYSVEKEEINPEKACDTAFLKSFKFVGDKTASFYLKFLLLIFEKKVGRILPIVIDTHVKQSLKKNHCIDQKDLKNHKLIKDRIICLSEQLGVHPIRLETALYKENFDLKND